METRAQQTFESGLLNEAALKALASQLASRINAPLVIYLSGELGAGKTTFARALIQASGYPGHVKSPTYGLLELYSADRFEVLHLDLYRIAESAELEFLGLGDLIDSNTIVLIEWPEKGGRFLPDADVAISLSHQKEQRKMSVLTYSDSGNQFLKQLTRLSKQVSS